MAIAFDASSESNGVGDFSWTHTPSGTPKGVVVLLSGDSFEDDVVGVTYGGVAMSRVNYAFVNSGEDTSSWAYFLGSNIPTGAQTVAIDIVASPSNWIWATAITVTAASDKNTHLAGIGSAKQQAVTTNPTVTVTGIAGASYGFGVLGSGSDAEGSSTAGSGMTMRQQFDFGGRTGSAESSTSESASGDLTIAFSNASSEESALIGVAIEEVSSASAASAPLSTLLLMGAG